MLVKATITHLPSLESLEVPWNPRAYSVARSSTLSAPALIGGSGAPVRLAGSAEVFSTRLLLDSTGEEASLRDLRGLVEKLERWAGPEREGLPPPRIIFSWGSFRFGGRIEELRQEWIRFDADGTPVRGWIDLGLRK